MMFAAAPRAKAEGLEITNVAVIAAIASSHLERWFIWSECPLSTEVAAEW
jgi:hypothetical protein